MNVTEQDRPAQVGKHLRARSGGRNNECYRAGSACHPERSEGSLISQQILRCAQDDMSRAQDDMSRAQDDMSGASE